MKKAERRNKVGIQEIADALSISASTVSRALNDHPRISLQTKEKVKSMALKLGYQVNIPELMAPEKGESILVFVPDIRNRLFQEVISGITDLLEDRGYFVFLLDSHGDRKSKEYFSYLVSKTGFRGIIHILGNRKQSDKLYHFPLFRQLPLVTLFDTVVKTNISSVLLDFFQGFQNVLTHFNSLHIHSVGLLLENNDDPVDFQIRTSFEMAADTLGIKGTIKPIFIYSETQPKKLAEQLEVLFTKEKGVDALLVKSVEMVPIVYQTAEKTGKKIPEDILLIAVGTMHEDLWMESLSMIKIPAYALGRDAAGMLLDQMEHGVKEKRTVVKPAGFILKGSAIRLE